MKINSDTSFPHPILNTEWDHNGGWYDSGDFKLIVNYDEKVENVEIEAIIDQNEIIDLIESQKASLMIIVECSRTRYRKRYEIELNKKNHLSFEKGAFKAFVYIQGFVSLKENVDNYKSSSIKKSITNLKKHFKILQGDLLAISCPGAIEVKDERLGKDYWQLVKSPKNSEHQIHINLAEDIAQIVVSKEMHKIITDLRSGHEIKKKKAKRLLMISIYLSAYQEAIHEIENENSDYSENHWFQSLQKQINSIKEDEHLSAYELAQKICEDPYSQLLPISNDIFNDEGDL